MAKLPLLRQPLHTCREAIWRKVAFERCLPALGQARDKYKPNGNNVVHAGHDGIMLSTAELSSSSEAIALIGAAQQNAAADEGLPDGWRLHSEGSKFTFTFRGHLFPGERAAQKVKRAFTAAGL